MLGYHRLTPEQRGYFEAFFTAAKVLPMNPPVLDAAVRLRQQQKVTLGDALIAATALTHGLTLVTHNTSDFSWVPSLKIMDPLVTST